MKKYHVATSGFEGYVTMTDKELSAYIKDETKKARRYFGTAVAHKKTFRDGDIHYEITSRRDKQSARWAFITARKH